MATTPVNSMENLVGAVHGVADMRSRVDETFRALELMATQKNFIELVTSRAVGKPTTNVRPGYPGHMIMGFYGV